MALFRRNNTQYKKAATNLTRLQSKEYKVLMGLLKKRDELCPLDTAMSNAQYRKDDLLTERELAAIKKRFDKNQEGKAPRSTKKRKKS
jgi:hypothetical protein